MKLSNRIEVYVPAVKGHEFAYQDTMKLLSGLCGGSTETKANGSWIDGQGNLILDDIHLVTAYYSRLSIGDIRKIVAHVRQLKLDLTQELISVSYSGSLHLI